MKHDTHPSPLPARLATIREQLQLVLPDVQTDTALRRALLHAQSAVETRLGLPREASRRGGPR